MPKLRFALMMFLAGLLPSCHSAAGGTIATCDSATKTGCDEERVYAADSTSTGFSAPDSESSDTADTLMFEYTTPRGVAEYIRFDGELTNAEGNLIWVWGSLEEQVDTDTLVWSYGPLASGDTLRSSVEFAYGSDVSWGCIYDSGCGDPESTACYVLQGTATSTFRGDAVEVELTGAPSSTGCEFTLRLP